MSKREYLPGDPPPQLVRQVRATLRLSGIRPLVKQWKLAWKWADSIRQSYAHPRWPIPSEIAVQYLVLMLADWRDSGPPLQLPTRARDVMPIEVSVALVQSPHRLKAADSTHLPRITFQG